MAIIKASEYKEKYKSNIIKANQLGFNPSANTLLKRQKEKEQYAKEQSEALARAMGVNTKYLSTREKVPTRQTALNVLMNTPKYEFTPSEQNIPTEKVLSNIENKYNAVYESPLYQNYVEEMYKTPLYQYKADLETIQNPNNISKVDKLGGSAIVGGLRSALHIDQQYKTKNKYGETIYVDLPNLQQLKTQEIISQYDTSKFTGKLGKLYQEAMQSVGQMIPSIVAGAVTGGLGFGKELGALGIMAVNAYAGSQNEMLLNGISKQNASNYALMAAGVEVLTEKMFGGLGKLMGTGALDEVFTKKLTKNITNKVVKTLAELGISSIGEGVEEIVSGAVNPFIQKLSGVSKEDLWTLIKDTNLAEDFFAGVLSSIILGSVPTLEDASRRVKADTQRFNFIETEIGRKLTKAEKNNIGNILDNSDNIDDTLNDIINELKANNPTTNASNVDLNSIEAEITALQEQKSKTTDTNEISQIEAQINTLQQQLDTLNQNMSTLVENSQNEPNLTESTLINDEQIKNLADSVKARNISVNTPEYKFAKALETKLGVKIAFKNNVKTPRGESVNGFYDPFTKTIELNTRSGQTVQRLLTHELTHALEGTAQMQQLQDFVISYFGARNENLWQSAYSNLASLYFPVYGNRTDFNEKVQSEATAEILGNLINDQEFLNRLAKNKPKVFLGLYARVNELIARVTGSEKAFLKAVKAKMEIAWKEALEQKNNKSYNNSNFEAGISFSLGNYGTSLMNRFYNALSKRQWHDFLTKIENGEIVLSEDKDTDVRYGDKVIFARIKHGKPQVVDAYEVNQFTLNKLGVSFEELFEILDSELGKEGYSEGEIKKISEMFGTASLFNRYSTKSHTFTDTSRKSRRGSGTINDNNSASKNRKRPIRKNGSNAIRNNGELDSSFSLPLIKEIQGMKATKSEVEDAVYDKFEQMMDEYGYDVDNIEGIYLHGSRLRGTAKADSDLDAVVFYIGNENEDDIFNTINNENNQLVIDGVKVDINPVSIDSLSEIDDYIARSEEYDKEKLKESDMSYSLPMEHKKDNQGHTLTKSQENYFKDSKARDDDGNLKVVYHTMTNEGKQFNEFNPVGTEYYRFGDQVVNYYTDSKDMSGSYANQDYKMADTKRITSMKQAEDYIDEMNKNGWGSNRKYELIRDNGKYVLIDNSEVPNSNQTWQEVYDEANEYKRTLTEEELAQFKDMFENEVRQDRAYDIDAYLKRKGYEFGSKQDEIAQKYLQIDNKSYPEAGIYFDVLMRDAKYHAIESFENEQDLYRRLKSAYEHINRYQYEGYVNITNPYTVDAEERNWNQVISQSNDFIDELESRVPEDIKNNLTRLYRESENISAEARDNYNTVEKVLHLIDNSTPLDENIRKVNTVVRRVGFDNIEQLLDGVPLGVNGWYNLAESLEEEGLIGSATKSFIINEFRLPEQVKNLIEENYNKKFGIHEILYIPDVVKLMNQVGRETTLKDLYNKNFDNYEQFDKYRMPNSYFLEQISADGNDYLGKDLEDIFETRAEIYGADQVGDEIAKAASVAFSKPELIRLWGTSKTTNDIVKEVIASNKDGKTNYDGVIIKNVYDYGGHTDSKKQANDLYITFNSNQFKAIDNKKPTNDADIRYSVVNDGAFEQFLEEEVRPLNPNKQESSFEDIRRRVLNPIQISKLTKEDAKTTPNLPGITRNKNNDGKSKFAKNIENKVGMLSQESKDLLLEDDDVRFYDKVTNEESLEEAFDRLNKNGKSETINWFSKDSKNANSTDVAEGWILLKQYQDAANNATNEAEKNEANRSMVEVAKKLRDIGTKAGQTVQAFNILNRLTPEGMVYYAQSELDEAFNQMVKNKTKEWIDSNRDKFQLTPDEVQFIMDTMQEISTMEDGYDKRVKLAEIQKLMTDKLPPEKGARIKSWMRISMLFNPKTQVRNIAGNALIAPINSFGDLFASYADKIVSRKTGVRTTGTTNVKALLNGFKRGAYEATNDYKKGINTRDMEGNRFEIGEGKSFNDKTIIGRTLNRTEALLNYVMDAGDRVFSEAAFENSIQNQMKLNGTEEITQDMIDIAHQEALSRTWNDNNEYTKFVLTTRFMLNKIKIGGYGLGDVLIPFAKTPANLTKAIVDYSPVGMINAIKEGNNLRKSLSNGQFTAQMQHKFVQDLGKAVAGTALYILGYALAKAKISTGKSDDDKDVANFLKNTLGISSYSIKLGNKSFTYDWAQPVAAPLAITSNIVSSKNNKTALLEGITSSLNSAGSILLEQSFLQSLNDVLTDNDGIFSGLETEILELPARAIPTFVKQIADMTDGTQRQTYEYKQPAKSALNYAKSKLPGISKTLAPKVDTMGREIQKYGGNNNIFNVFLNPANVNTQNISSAAKEIYNVYQKTGDNTIMPRVAPYYVGNGDDRVVFTPEQVASFQKTSGEIIEKSVSKLASNSSYKKLSYEDKAAVLNDIINYSYNVAKSKVLNTDISSDYTKANDYIKAGGNIGDYYIYRNATSGLSADKDKNGKSISGSKKEKVIDYINTMNISVKLKLYLIEQNGYSTKGYRVVNGRIVL